MAIATSTALLALSGIGLGAQTYGTIRSGQAQKRAGEKAQDAANSQADLADANAAIADLQAADAVARGADEESRFRVLVRQSIGAQRAGFAASNINVATGSAVDVQVDAAVLGELDALTIRTNAAREAWGYKVQAYDYRRRGEITRKEGVAAAESGAAAQTASRWQAGASLFAGGASLLEQRYGFGRAGR